MPPHTPHAPVAQSASKVCTTKAVDPKANTINKNNNKFNINIIILAIRLTAQNHSFSKESDRLIP